MIGVLCGIWEFLLDHFWAITALIIVVRYARAFYKTFVFDPLAGGNGKVQMDELAKGIVVALIIWAVQRDGYRDHEWAYFSDAFYAALLAALFAIAAIKPVVGIWKKEEEKEHEDEQDSDNSNLPRV